MSLQIKTPPTAEPVTVEEVKTRLRLTTSAFDAAIASDIVTARAFCESISGRSLAAKTYLYTVDTFPYPRRPLQLLRPPLIEVVEVKYLDDYDEWQTWDPAEYLVGSHQEPGVIVPKRALVYPCPVHAPGLDTVSVEYKAGAYTHDLIIKNVTDIAVFIFGHPGEPIPINLVQLPKIHY